MDTLKRESIPAGEDDRWTLDVAWQPEQDSYCEVVVWDRIMPGIPLLQLFGLDAMIAVRDALTKAIKTVEDGQANANQE